MFGLKGFPGELREAHPWTEILPLSRGAPRIGPLKDWGQEPALCILCTACPTSVWAGPSQILRSIADSSDNPTWHIGRLQRKTAVSSSDVIFRNKTFLLMVILDFDDTPRKMVFIRVRGILISICTIGGMHES
jgi:hypothetical protein